MRPEKAMGRRFKEGDYVVNLRDDGANLPTGAIGQVLPYAENDYVGTHATDRVRVRFPVPVDSGSEGIRGMRPEWLRAATEDEIFLFRKKLDRRSVIMH
jgi:hypothetical protein